MRFFERRKPNVKSLAKVGNVDGLVEASQYSEILSLPDGARTDAGAPVREEAILALGESSAGGDRETIVARLTEALSDPVDRVRCAAVMTLYRLEEPDPLAEAVATLPIDAGQARAMAIRALLALRAPCSSATLAKALLYREDELALGDATEVVATLIEEEGTPGAAKAVSELAVAALRDARSVVAFRAEELLVRLGPASRDLLVEELAQRHAAPRAAAILGKVKDSRALEPLVTALRHPDPRVRSQSCAALGELRDPAAAEPLLAATRDSEYEVRVNAGEALDRLGTAAIVVSVAALLRPLIEAQAPPVLPLGAGTNGHALPGSGSLEWELVLDEGPRLELPEPNSSQPCRSQGPQRVGNGREPSLANGDGHAPSEAPVTDSSPPARPRD